MDNINRAGVTLGKDDGILNSVAPTPLKEQFLKLLDSKVDALEEMSNILKMEGTVTKYATVCELVRSYEERSGQLSLYEWKNILGRFGFGKDFHLCLTAHQRGLMVLGVSSCAPPNVNTACKPSSGAIPKKQSTQRQLRKADDQEPTDTGCEIQVVVAEDYNQQQLPVSDLDTTTGERTEKIEKNPQSLSSECPPQSLPPPEDNAITDVAKGNIEKDSGTDVFKVFNRLVSNVNSQQSNSGPKGPPSPEEVAVKHSVVVHYGGLEESGCPAENDEQLDKDTQELVRKFGQMYIKKEEECKKLAAMYIKKEEECKKLAARYMEMEEECKKLAAYILQQDKHNHRANVRVAMLKQENIELCEELDSAVGKIEMQKLANEQRLQEEHRMFQRMAEEFKRFQESNRKQVKSIQVKLIKVKRKRKRAEIQLARERCQRKRVERELGRAKSKEKKMEKRNKKKMEDLKQNESFLVQELRQKTVHLDNCQAQYTRLQQDLEVFRGQITAELQSVQTSSAEWQRRFQESTELIAESQELCIKARQMYLWKEQECERMKEHIEQNEQRYDECNRDLENLRREREEQQEELQELHLAFKMVEELKLEYDNKRKECEYNLDRRMVEMSQAFCKAESDRMKIMKVKLAEEIRRRKKMKKQLTKERNIRKRVELEKAIEKRRGKRMEKRKKEHRCQCLRKEKKGEGPSGGTRGGYGGHVSRDEGDLSSIEEEESSEREITTGPDDSLENEDTK